MTNPQATLMVTRMQPRPQRLTPNISLLQVSVPVANHLLHLHQPTLLTSPLLPKLLVNLPNAGLRV